MNFNSLVAIVDGTFLKLTLSMEHTAQKNYQKRHQDSRVVSQYQQKLFKDIEADPQFICFIWEAR